jgi:hypothetical protein
MLHGTDTTRRGQFSLRYTLLVLTNTSLVLGGWCICESPGSPEWVLPFAGAAVLIGIYGYIALAIVPLLHE